MILVTCWAESPKFTAQCVVEWVANMRHWSSLPIRILCPETDRQKLLPILKEFEMDEVEVRALKHPDWKIWWGKMELFAEQTESQLFIDLDSRVAGNLGLLELHTIDEDLVMLADERIEHVLGGGVLLIRPSKFGEFLYESMVKYSAAIQIAYTQLPYHFGDQGFIQQMALKWNKKVATWQEIRPGHFYCCTPGTRSGDRPYADETIVYLSGEPTLDRLTDPEAPWNQ